MVKNYKIKISILFTFSYAKVQQILVLVIKKLKKIRLAQ